MISDLFDNDPRQIGPYRLLGRIGAGGMGVVYLGSSPAEDVVAVKLIRAVLAQDPSFRARFAREVDAARRVGGTCTARVRDADLEADRPWVVTDFVAGPNLADLVARHGPLPADQQRALAIGLAEALAAVHRAGIVHRDLKPTNVLCSPAGPRLIDFGIARAADATSATLPGQVVGSPSWMAPEQIRGEPATPAIDLFALGSVLIFAATGRPPFGQGQMEAVMYRILNEEPDLGQTGALAPELVPHVTTLLAKDPASRPSPGHILNDLAGITANPAQAVTVILDRTWELPAGEAIRVPAPRGLSAAIPPPRKRRRKAVAATAAIIAVVALVAALLLLKPTKGHNPQAGSTTTVAASAQTSKTIEGVPTSRAIPTPTEPASTVPPVTPVAVASCATQYGIPNQAAPAIPASLDVPTSMSSELAGYSNGYLNILAPVDWTCSGVDAADGGESLDAYPANETASALDTNAASTNVGVTVQLPAAGTGPAAYSACPFFPTARTAFGGGTPCTTAPAGEVIHQAGPNVVEFEDPPGVTGDARPSGGPNPANGVIIWYQSSGYAAEAACTLPQQQHQLCTAILNDFLSRYGTPPPTTAPPTTTAPSPGQGTEPVLGET